ncbi:hypothetical protein Ahy_A09g042787 [Arachis hypogaea]|uniref:Aminotransferase-like plant mobile domain-containing protein n=1 Tax=Arachis hypogaea TaxID=3818 RepID=A0A445BGR7_ARAHY|nr:hypothetical protein Ahy_A09g042787 [Arachis hypogaea]
MDKSITHAHPKYLQLLRDFERIHKYSWVPACLVHLYKVLCRASRYDTKEIDDPLNMLFVWAWEQLPCIVPFVWWSYKVLIIPDELHEYINDVHRLTNCGMNHYILYCYLHSYITILKFDAGFISGFKVLFAVTVHSFVHYNSIILYI